MTLLYAIAALLGLVLVASIFFAAVRTVTLNVLSQIFSVNGAGIMLTGAFLLWSYYYFVATGTRIQPAWAPVGFFTPENMWRNLAWTSAIYLSVEMVLAALSVAASASGSPGRKIAMILNLCSPLAVGGLLLWVRAQSSINNLAPEKVAFLDFCQLVAALDFVGCIMIGFLVAGRVFGWGSGGGSA